MQTFTALASRLIIFLLAIASAGASAQTNSDQWSGIWQAEGTLFTLNVTNDNEQLYIRPEESLGFIWQSGVGHIDGLSAAMEVRYQGAIGMVLVQLEDSGTAIARALSCVPDYHVVCALVKNQQVRFVKIEGAINSTP